jgi:hypothetical protein
MTYVTSGHVNIHLAPEPLSTSTRLNLQPYARFNLLTASYHKPLHQPSSNTYHSNQVKMSDSTNPFNTKTNKSLNTTTSNDSNIQGNVAGAAKGATSILGSTVGGLTNTAGSIVGAATRGVGETVNSATGQTGKPVGDAVSNIGSGVEGGARETAEGVKRAGEWKGAS